MTGNPSPSSAAGLRRIRDLWALEEQDLARVFDVSADEIRRWVVDGVPEIHVLHLSDLVVATDTLQGRLRRETVAEIVRRPAPTLQGRSLLQLALAHRYADVRAAVEEWLNLRRVQP